ncbi:MAG: hypothetical protein HYR94_12340 [Chloroflexi bacterium]|nr:hypothetical protein [Chloroflexota bacterium]
MTTPTFYQIKVKGHLDQHWSEWFDGLTITHATNGETVLSGSVMDQAALHGLLLKIRDLNLTLLAVNRVEMVQTSTSGTATTS